VPRVWEKMVAGLQAQLATADPAVRAAVEGASALAVQIYELRAAKRAVPEELAARFLAADSRVLRPLRARLGLDNVLWAGSGAAPIPVEVLRYLAGLGVDVLEVWGMTETTGTATINTPDHFRTGTVGRVNPGMELKIGEDGEIFVRGPLVCAGYLSPDGGVAPVVDEDGWLATGDVGVLDDDGYLTITDRVSDIIIRGGENISAQEVEELLLRVEGIAEVSVVAAPDARLGEHAAAVVRLLPNATVTLDDLRARLAASGLAKQKWPESLYTVTEFPRTPSGKVQKFRLRQQLRDGELAAAP